MQNTVAHGARTAPTTKGIAGFVGHGAETGVVCMGDRAWTAYCPSTMLWLETLLAIATITCAFKLHRKWDGSPCQQSSVESM